MSPHASPKAGDESQAITTRTTFRLSISVATVIDAPATTIWPLLTDLHAQSSWNSTLASIDGKVALGEQVTFRVQEAHARAGRVNGVRHRRARSRTVAAPGRQDVPRLRPEVRADGGRSEGHCRGARGRLTATRSIDLHRP